MKRREKERGGTPHTLRVYSFGEAQEAAPYIGSVVRSLREHTLEALSQRSLLNRLERKSGRPTRTDLIATQEGRDALSRAEMQFQDAEEELRNLDIFSLDPLAGLALVPFVHDDQLAWYIFDQFDPTNFRFWRFQSDPEETRRELTGAQKR